MTDIIQVSIGECERWGLNEALLFGCVLLRGVCVHEIDTALLALDFRGWDAGCWQMTRSLDVAFDFGMPSGRSG
jgi:hypothetical protein